MYNVVRDLRYSIRSLTKSWGFTAVAVATLALGTGATTTVFSIANAIIYRPLNNGASGDLVRLYSRDRTEGGRYRSFSCPNFLDIRANHDVFDDVAALDRATRFGAGSAQHLHHFRNHPHAVFIVAGQDDRLEGGVIGLQGDPHMPP